MARKPINHLMNGAEADNLVYQEAMAEASIWLGRHCLNGNIDCLAIAIGLLKEAQNALDKPVSGGGKVADQKQSAAWTL